MNSPNAPDPIRFGNFELAVAAGELRMGGRRIRLQPQPLKLLTLLARRAGTVVTREEIRRELWADGTFVDFDQAVNFSIKQVRDVLRDDADRPIYIETVPRRGYRFIAPVNAGGDPMRNDGTTARLQKALWENVAELRLAEARRRRYLWFGLSTAGAVLLVLLVLLTVR